ncbi:hypothetical protein G5O_0445 [Chlamydia psittaci 6BC]|nr:hypothetical protein G5O_0445 [Chlamydia psittaci 6BC]
MIEKHGECCAATKHYVNDRKFDLFSITIYTCIHLL